MCVPPRSTPWSPYLSATAPHFLEKRYFVSEKNFFSTPNFVQPKGFERLMLKMLRNGRSQWDGRSQCLGTT